MEGKPGMDICKTEKGCTISSKQEYLHWLGKYLLLFFPVKQVLEILSDYQEYVSEEEEKESMENTIKQWGTPRHALKILLEENPQTKRYFYQCFAFWGAAICLSFIFGAYVRKDIFLSLLLLPAFIFCFLHGREQLIIENYLLIKADNPKRTFAVYLFLTVLCVLLEAEIQCFIKNIEKMPAHLGGIPIGFVIDREYAFFQFIILLLIIWMIKKTVTVSVQYLPDIIYALGVLLFIADVRNCLHRVNLLTTVSLRKEFLFPVIYCGIGLGIAVVLKSSAALMGRHGLWTHR